jgi:hypothetical protein
LLPMVAAREQDPKAYLLKTAIAPEIRGRKRWPAEWRMRTRLVIGRGGEPRLLRPMLLPAY